jgi:hypothetical protein
MVAIGKQNQLQNIEINMKIFINLNSAIYFRFKKIIILVEGENGITHISSILLLSIFHMCLFFLLMLVCHYSGIEFFKFPNGNFGKVIAVIFTFTLIGTNLILLKNVDSNYSDSIFVKNNEPTLFTDLIIIFVILLIIIFARLDVDF